MTIKGNQRLRDLGVVWMCLLVFGSPAFPHALDPESMDRYAEITLTPSHLVLIYQVFFGVNPTERITRVLDADNDGVITDAERTAVVDRLARVYATKQVLRINDQDLSLEFRMGDAYAALGHNAIQVIKVDLAYVARYPADIPRQVTCPFTYEDQNFIKIPGWKQIQVLTRDSAQFEGHIPYTEYKPFDFEIINTKGFVPSTDAISGNLFLPLAQEVTNPDVALPVKQEIPRPETIDIVGMRIVAGTLITLLILGAAGYWGLRLLPARRANRSEE